MKETAWQVSLQVAGTKQQGCDDEARTKVETFGMVIDSHIGVGPPRY